MKNLTIVAILLAVLAIGTVMAININDTTPQDEIVNEKPTTCSYQGQNGCTQENSCGRSSCGIKTTESCGCRK